MCEIKFLADRLIFVFVFLSGCYFKVTEFRSFREESSRLSSFWTSETED